MQDQHYKCTKEISCDSTSPIQTLSIFSSIYSILVLAVVKSPPLISCCLWCVVWSITIIPRWNKLLRPYLYPDEEKPLKIQIYTKMKYYVPVTKKSKISSLWFQKTPMIISPFLQSARKTNTNYNIFQQPSSHSRKRKEIVLIIKSKKLWSSYSLFFNDSRSWAMVVVTYEDWLVEKMIIGTKQQIYCLTENYL